tara:strand:- start:275 stop:1429 length:1155 start_codon:yes stop_codon:yes gene_type:complete
MGEIMIYSIFGFLLGILIAAILYFYWLRKKNDNNNHILIQNEGLIKEIAGLKKNESTLLESLNEERKTTAAQLQTINKIDEHKTSISNYRTTTEERNKLDKENIDLMKNYLEKLTGSSRFQGDVGEKILKNILYSCGLRNSTDFLCQEGDKVIDPEDNDTIRNVRPDTLIRIGESWLVIDSKVSLDNWKNWVNEKKDEKLKESYFKKHLESVNNHIKTLSSKPYSKLLKRKVFPHIIMFIPFEAGYLSALEADPNLGEKSYKENIILAGPGNIMAIIKIVETIKSKDKQIENVGEITKSATKLYDKYVTLKGFLKKIVTSYRTHGTNLQSAINNIWGGKDSFEKQMINLKNKHGLFGKNIEPTLPAEDKVLDVNDPEDKGPYIN